MCLALYPGFLTAAFVTWVPRRFGAADNNAKVRKSGYEANNMCFVTEVRYQCMASKNCFDGS